MKKRIMTIVPLALAWVAHGQSISPQVVASSGTHFSGASGQLSWTTGESVVSTVGNGSNIITQGFHQTVLTVTSLNETSASATEISVFPNPSSDHLNIKLSDHQGAMLIDLYDLNGKLLESHNIQAEENLLQINMERHAAATYMLSIHSSDGKENNTYKIQKTSVQ